MNKISIDNAEKMTPQELVEVIINNVPHDKIRTCLTNLEKVSPVEVQRTDTQSQSGPSVDPPPQPVVSNMKSIEELRRECSKNPILIVDNNTELPGKSGKYVVYYTQNKQGVFAKNAKKVELFNKNGCNNLPDVDNEVCDKFYDWVKNSLTKENKEKISQVVKEYIRDNIDLFNKDCSKYREIMELLDIKGKDPVIPVIPIKQTSVNTNKVSLELQELAKELTPATGVLIWPKPLADGKVRIYTAFKNKEGNMEWASKEQTINYINEKVRKIKAPVKGTARYDRFKDAFETIRNLPKGRNMIVVVKQLKKLGIEVPYDFLV